MKNLLRALAVLLLSASPALAVTCSSNPFTLVNGQTADATQVMSNFNNLLTCSNTLLAPLASPTFTGTVTFPDSGTWAAGGISATTWNSGTFAGTITLSGTISGGTFTGPTLTNPTISGASITSSTFTNTTLAGTTTLTGGLVATGQTITGGTFSGPTLSGAIDASAATVSGGTFNGPTVNNCVGCQVRFVSTQQGIPAGGSTLTVAHTTTGGSAASGGFFGNPFSTYVIAHNVTADVGYSPGDEIVLSAGAAINITASNYGVSVYADTTNVNVVVANNGIAAFNKGTGAAAAITSGAWKIIVKASQ